MKISTNLCARRCSNIFFELTPQITIHPSESISHSPKSAGRHSLPPRPNVKIKPASDSDWLFKPLWEEPESKPARPIKREKISLVAQLEESSVNLFGKKKAISLKDQLKFLAP
jgi:hypothetical protein